MGCAASKKKKEARVQVCKERRRLMKQLLGLRREFADAQEAYLIALKNTGVTLKQFTESEYIEPENSPPFVRAIRVPPPLPPPPPPFSSPESPNSEDYPKIGETAESEITEVDDSRCGASAAAQQRRCRGQGEEENWAETNTEFAEEVGSTDGDTANLSSQMTLKEQVLELADDNSSVASWHTKDAADDRAMVVGRSKNKLADVIRELDDYFLKASYAGKPIALLMDVHAGRTLHRQNLKENKRKRYNSAKVFSAWSWNRSSKLLQSARDSIDYGDSSEPCRPGAHGVTLEKIYALEQKLFKEVKDEENLKLERERKSLLLQKQEDEKYHLAKTEKTRHAVQNLQRDITFLEQLIRQTCSSIVRLINDELYPQLFGIISGMMEMWRTMYESHRFQNHICQRLNNLNIDQNMDPITNYHQQATTELEAEVAIWYHSFCRLIFSQQEYVKALSEWVQHTKGLINDDTENCFPSFISNLCEDWQLTLDGLPHKVASEALKNLLTAVHSIVLQQEDERNLKKRRDKLENKWEKELKSLSEMNEKLKASLCAGDTRLSLSPMHPVSVKRAKADTLKKQFESEKAKHLRAVQLCRAMTMNSLLQTSLPSVFRSLVAFSFDCVKAFEGIRKQTGRFHEEAIDVPSI